MPGFKRKRRTRRRGTVKRRKMRRVATMGTVRRAISRAEETKFGYYAANNQTSTSGAYVAFFGNLSQGTTNVTRIGQKVTAIQLELRLGMQANPLNSSRIRALVIRDRQCNGALPPSTTDPFLDKTNGQQWFSGFDPATVGRRYQILMDRTYNLNVQGGATDLPERKMCIWKKRNRYPVIYNGNNSGTVGDINKGAIYLFIAADVTANYPVYWYEILVKYKDA